VDVLRYFSGLFGRAEQPVAYAAHIAGYLYGFTLAVVLLALNIVKREEFDVFYLFKQSRRRAAFRAANKPNTGAMWDAPPAPTSRDVPDPGEKPAPLSPADERTAQRRAEITGLIDDHDLPAAAARSRALLADTPDAVLPEQRQLDVGNQLYAESDHPTAAAAYELLLEYYPMSSRAGEVRLILGLLYARKLDRPSQARELITAALTSLHDAAQRALAHELLAELGT
jgi:tetratricopeptide (TPR) repeat protein